jgi:hypothetical protein
MSGSAFTFTLLILGLCAAMIVMQSLARRTRYQGSKRFKIINLSVSILILIVFISIAAALSAQQTS